MQVTRAPARLGWSWVTTGFALVMRRPLPMIGLTSLMFFSLALTGILPGISGALGWVLTPLLSAGFMHAVRWSETSGPLSPWAVFEYFKNHHRIARRRLLMLGGIHGAVTLLAVVITALVDGGTLFKLITGIGSVEPPPIQDSKLIIAALVLAMLYTPIQMAMWFAPVFVAWHGLAPVRALFYSLVGVWRNKAVFSVYLLGWMAVLMAISVAAQIATLAVPTAVVALLIWPVFLVMLAAFCSSFWPTYRDLVHDNEAATTSAPQQLD
jgi:hypothetical protein